MVKFSKQFEGQLIPEWKEAFVDYSLLKKNLKKIHLISNKDQDHGSLSNAFFSPLKKFSLFGHQHKEHGVIQVHKKLASSASKSDLYETELLEQFADTDAAKEFFARLDVQLNKVNQFYKEKEKEFMERGESLNKQMEILVDLKTSLKRQRGLNTLNHDLKEDASISCTISSDERSLRDVIDQLQDYPTCGFEGKEAQTSDSPKADNEIAASIKIKRDESKMRTLSGRDMFNRQIRQGKNVRINIPLSTPTQTLSALSDLVREDLVSPSRKCSSGRQSKLQINKTKLHHADKIIRGAFIELYKGLSYLKTYRNLNMLAFVKILKKFDKVTEKQALPIYLKVVESSYFNISNKVVKLADEVEELFRKQFTDDDRGKAMKYLKPRHRKESHSVTFFIGLFTGCFVALFIGYVIMAHIAGMYTQQSDTIYMETVYPIISMFGLIFLHFFLYGCDIFMWRRTRINYNFIFELAPTKDLKYRDVFLICTTSMTAVVGIMFVHLFLIAKGYSSNSIRAIPGILLLLFLLVLICPFNIVYRSSRYRFLQAIRNIVLTPLYKVAMLDFFMADQLCSQVPTLRSLEYITCYYITGSYKTQDYGFCMRTKHYKDLAYAVSFLPYCWRAMQCARRWFDEGEMGHLINLGKYVSALCAAGAKVAYEKEKSSVRLAIVVIMSSSATIYQLYWDFVKDWGLLQSNSRNPWLRNELLLRRKIIYYFSMGLNLILRLAWLQTVLHYNFGSLDYRVMALFFAVLEVIRRGQWNFYRLENEHLNNAGKFRAVKSVPLPFHEVDNQD